VRLHRWVTWLMFVFALFELALVFVLTQRQGSLPVQLVLLVLLTVAIGLSGLRQQRKWKA